MSSDDGALGGVPLDVFGGDLQEPGGAWLGGVDLGRQHVGGDSRHPGSGGVVAVGQARRRRIGQRSVAGYRHAITFLRRGTTSPEERVSNRSSGVAVIRGSGHPERASVEEMMKLLIDTFE